MVDYILKELWTNVSPSIADMVLFLMCVGLFMWFKWSLKLQINRLTEVMNASMDRLTTSLNTTAKTLKEQLELYNRTHKENWETMKELVLELKTGKVWENEYKLQVENIKERAAVRDERIDDLDERLKCIERGRRYDDKG